MNVRLLVSISGTRDGQDWPPAGSVVDLPADEAEHLVAAGLAAAQADTPAPVETAAQAPAETAARKPARPRKPASKPEPEA